MGKEHPWRDKEKCIKEYVENGKTIKQIAEEWNAGITTVYKWLDKYGIDTSRNRQTLPESHELNDPEIVKQLHHDDGMSVTEIARKYGVDRTTVKRRIDKFDIEYIKHHDSDSTASIYVDKYGYEKVSVSSNPHDEDHTLRLHRLMLLPYIDPEKIFGNEFVVHHKNGIPWDNRLDNFEIMDNSEHSRLHIYDTKPWEAYE